MGKKHESYGAIQKTIGGWGSEYEVECFVCHKIFSAKRYDAAFCSATCRSRHLRQRQMAVKRAKEATRAVTALIEHLPSHGADNAVFDALQGLQVLISRALANVEERDGQKILPVWMDVKK